MDLKAAQSLSKPKLVEKSIEAGSDSNKSADDPFQNELKQVASGTEVCILKICY